MSDAIKNAIKIDRKETGKWMYELEFTVPADAVNAEFAEAVKTARRHAQLPGFRVGKAPASMVKARYADVITDDVDRSIKSAAFEKMTSDDSLDIVIYGRPSEGKPAENAEFKFTFDIEVAPEFAMPDYKSFKIEGDAGADAESRANDRIEHLRSMYADFTKLESGSIQAEDMVKVSFECDFELPADASDSLKRAVASENSWVWINEPEQYPGMIKALTGANIGDTVTFEADFPADWREAALQGKKVKYTFKLHEIQRKSPVTDNEALAKKAGLESFAKLEEQMKSAAEREREYAKAESARDQALKMLLEAVPDMEFPKNILASTVQKEFSRIAERTVKSEEEVEAFKKDQEKHLEEAKKAANEYLKKFFILRKIAKLEEIYVSQEELDMQINAMAAYMGYKVADVKNMLARRGGEEELQADILMGKTLDKVAGNNKE